MFNPLTVQRTRSHGASRQQEPTLVWAPCLQKNYGQEGKKGGSVGSKQATITTSVGDNVFATDLYTRRGSQEQQDTRKFIAFEGRGRVSGTIWCPAGIDAFPGGACK